MKREQFHKYQNLLLNIYAFPNFHFLMYKTKIKKINFHLWNIIIALTL